MENKLQELTKKLYDEGLEKGRAEADRLVGEAKNEAAKIMKTAKKIRFGSQCVASQLNMSAVTTSPPTSHVMRIMMPMGTV